mmetsp:Transcript_68380/g.198206  ORF Transcript_68380/g.198206 Transcript_68380/m.198206 type:complete len:363 (-) Transcript_68380:246-1334(-)
MRPLGKSFDLGSLILGNFPVELERYCDGRLPGSGGRIAVLAPCGLWGGQVPCPPKGGGFLYDAVSPLSGASHDAHLPTRGRFANVAKASPSCATAAAWRKMACKSCMSAFCCKAPNMLECNASSQFRTSSRRPSTACFTVCCETLAGRCAGGSWDKTSSTAGALTSSKIGGAGAIGSVPAATSAAPPLLPSTLATRAATSPSLPAKPSMSRCTDLTMVVKLTSSRCIVSRWSLTCSSNFALCRSISTAGPNGRAMSAASACEASSSSQVRSPSNFDGFRLLKNRMASLASLGSTPSTNSKSRRTRSNSNCMSATVKLGTSVEEPRLAALRCWSWRSLCFASKSVSRPRTADSSPCKAAVSAP